MKYIKTYENFDIYKVDDYICIDSNYFTDHKERFAKIIKRDDLTGFTVLFVDGNVMWTRPSMVMRRLTNDEIEKFEAEISAQKYNI